MIQESGYPNTRAGASVKLPPGVTGETLVKYRELAIRAIGAGKDTLGVQAKRVEIIDAILRSP